MNKFYALDEDADIADVGQWVADNFAVTAEILAKHSQTFTTADVIGVYLETVIAELEGMVDESPIAEKLYEARQLFWESDLPMNFKHTEVPELP